MMVWLYLARVKFGHCCSLKAALLGLRLGRTAMITQKLLSLENRYVFHPFTCSLATTPKQFVVLQYSRHPFVT
jgi:hypothetical protein